MADFNFYLNRQGVKGNKGEKGETGFAPIVEVAEDTAASYKLRIITDTDTLETPNLRGSAVDDLGGTYMRYDSETQKMYAAAADTATTSSKGEVILASDEAVADLSDVHALTPASLVDNYDALIQSSDGSVVITQDVNNSKINLSVDLSDIEGDVSGLDSRITGCETAIGNIEGDITDLQNNKVDKEAGKGLSTNDFTNADKSKLDSSLQPTSVDGTTIGLNAGGQLTLLAQIPTVPTNISAFINDSGYITGITSSNVITALGYTPYDASNPDGFISGINSTDVVNALGYTPYDSSNPNGYTSNVGTVTSVNNISPVSGNVTINIPTDTSDLTNGAGFITSVPTATTNSLGLVQPDGTTITINNGVISASSSAPSNMVTTDTAQTISGNKTFQNSNLILGTSTYSKFNLTNTFGDNLRPESSTSTGLMHFTYNNYQNVATVSANRTNINGSTRGLLRILPTTVYNHPETEGYIMTHNLVDMSYKPYLTSSKITSTGNTVTITDNGMNGINIEAASSTPTNMVTTDTSQTITANKTFSGNVDKDLSGDTLRLGASGAGRTGLICLSNNGARTWSICNSGYTSSTLEIADFNSVTIQGGNLSSDSKLVIGHDSLVFHKSDNTSVDLLAGGGSTPSNMATTDTAQTISGSKTFSSDITMSSGSKFSFISDSAYIGEQVSGYNIAMVANRSAIKPQTFKVGQEGIGTNYGLEGYFFDTSDGGNCIWLGETNYRSAITTTNGQGVAIYPNPLTNNAQERLYIGLNDTLTYRKSDGTVVDLLALESRIAALEARINGGNS